MMLVSIMAVFAYDNTVFDEFVIPEAMDKRLLEQLILQNLAELSLVYSDPAWLKKMIGAWSQGRVKIWEKLFDIATKDYNPIENYNRYDEEKGNENGGRKGTDDYQDYNYGYNKETERSHHDDRDEQFEETYYKNVNGGKHGHGNIGVTSTQNMLEQELNVRPKLDIYNYIVEDFKHNFCVMVY